MFKLKAVQFKEVTLLILVCVFSSALGSALRPNKTAIANSSPLKLLQQSDEKTIEKAEFDNEPFKFSDVSVQSTKISLNQKFNIKSLIEKSGGNVDSWLEHLEFTLKNTSGKRITYIAIALDFPETKANGPMMVYNQLVKGVPPHANEDPIKHTTPLVFEHDSTITFILTPQHLQSIKSFLAVRNFKLEEISKVVITVDYLIFDDGMKWQIGRFYKPNSNRPSGYEQVNPNTQ